MKHETYFYAAYYGRPNSIVQTALYNTFIDREASVFILLQKEGKSCPYLEILVGLEIYTVILLNPMLFV